MDNVKGYDMRQRTIIAGALAASLLLVGCGAQIDASPASEARTDDVDDVADAELEAPTEDVEPDDQPPVEDDADGDAEQADDHEPAADEPESTEGSDSGSSAPDEVSGDTVMEPDAERLSAPCADHQGRESEAFIDLVAPVTDQVASGQVEIVGCSNVNEATVAWTLLDGDGRTLDEGFTTAECGTGCVGEFRDAVSLDAAADEPVAYLQVFSPNASDEGPAQLQLTEVVLVIG